MSKSRRPRLKHFSFSFNYFWKNRKSTYGCRNEDEIRDIVVPFEITRIVFTWGTLGIISFFINKNVKKLKLKFKLVFSMKSRWPLFVQFEFLLKKLKLVMQLKSINSWLMPTSVTSNFKIAFQGWQSRGLFKTDVSFFKTKKKQNFFYTNQAIIELSWVNIKINDKGGVETIEELFTIFGIYQGLFRF